MVRRLKARQKRLTRLLSDLVIRWRTREFDPIFYIHHYEDLKALGSVGELRRHYANHGRKERRFPNQMAYFKYKKKEVLRSPGQFDVVAYKYYNRDLLAHFTSDEEFLEHFVRHGMNEGRVSRFPTGEGSDGEYETWQSIVSCPQVLAWSGDRFSYPPASRKEVIAALKERGIDELWPTNFDNIFDASFYRSTYKLPSASEKSDSNAYRHFLEEGFPRGHAPNEVAFLYSYLGGAPYPEHFDWAGYSNAAAMAGRPARISALERLFTARHRNFSPFVKFMENDAALLLGSIGKHALVKDEFETAVAAFDASLGIQNCADITCLLGHAYRGLGKAEEALAAYQQSVATGPAPISSYFHCIDIFCGRRDFDSAFAMLRQAWKSWRHKPSYYEKLENCIELYFQHRSAEAHRRYKNALQSSTVPGSRQEADELLRSTLEEIESLHSELDIMPAHTGGQPDGYVAILANDDLRQCTHYRVEQKVMQFEEAGIPVRLFSHHDVSAFMDSLVGARAAIFYRVAALPKILRAILHANRMGLPTYYEIDDLIFDGSCYPDPLSSFEDQISEEGYAGLQFGVPLFRYAMAMCNRSIASTPALAAKMQCITRSTTGIVVRNGLDSRNDMSIQMGAQPRPANGRIRIFYGSGTKAHNADFNELVGPALLTMMERHPEVDLVIVGHLKLRPELAALRDRVMVYPIIPDINAYWSLLASCDINLAVLHPGAVADCKSEIKWLEAAVLQIPSIVSETATYRDVVQHGVNGFLASNSGDWLQYLEKLIADKEVRERIGANARAKALRAYSLEAAAEVLRNTFGDAQRESANSVERRKLRILICNVFFDPQSVGGATRVVEDNIRSFTELYDDLEVGVFCSDDGVSPPGRLRMGGFGTIPVYRLSTPAEEGMDWRPFNPANEAGFERVLDHFKPDIIHFHCIQRLTASIAQVALQRDIPYLVTLHDGWWISDHQFLVDEDGFLRLPTEDFLADTKDSRRPLESIERRQRLATLLRGATARLSVSSSFARVYEKAGIRDIRVTENGLPAIAPAVRMPREDGRLSLGHIGGRAAHKGAFLVEAALRQEIFHNLHLTMVDGKIPAGQTVETTWGTTPVTLTGPYPQSRIADLYGKLDVLLAPSTWPESYGLVTREALSLGLWVVTSNLGAIGEGVEDDRNGYVIDTQTSAGLKKVLHRLDAEHVRYRRPPEFAALKLRTMEAQARELHAIYWDIARQQERNSHADPGCSAPHFRNAG